MPTRPTIYQTHRLPALRENSSKSGFALIIALSLMAFVVLLLLSITAMTRVEMMNSKNNKLQSEARANAMLGMQIALGQLQKHAGADQRVSAPATVHYPLKQDLKSTYVNNAIDVEGFKTALDQAGREAFNDELTDWWEGRNPRWTGIWNSTPTKGIPDRDQLPIWLVSGNEQFKLDPAATEYPAGYLTPDRVLPDPDNNPDYVWILGEGSAGYSAATTVTDAVVSADQMDGRVKVKRLPVNGGNGATGHYAYWVSDESQKANFTIRDPWYDISEISSERYRNRLQAPQRVGWENLEAFAAVFDANGLDPNDEDLDLLVSTDQLNLLHPDLSEASRTLFHDITTTSATLFTDTAQGGLKKDLTSYFERGSVLSDNDPIPDPSDYNGDDRFPADNDGFPLSSDNIPTWGQLKQWYDNEVVGGQETGSVALTENVGPVITGIRLHVGFSRNAGKIQMHLLPVLTIWNPFDAVLRAQNYDFEFEFPIGFAELTATTDDGGTPRFVGTKLPTDAAFLERHRPIYFLQGTTLRIKFNTSLNPGEVKVFSVTSDQPVSAPGAGGDLSITLAEGFDDDFPQSVYFPVLDIDPADALTANLRILPATLRLPGSIDRAVLSASPFEAIYTNYGRLNAGAVSSVSTIPDRTRGNLNASDTFAASRTLHPHNNVSSNFVLNITGQGPIYANEYPIFPVLETAILPLAYHPYYKLASLKTISNHIRLFANFNPGAVNFGVHPKIEGTRGIFASHNVDGYETINFAWDNVFANSASQAVRSKNTWDRGFTDTSGPGGATSGFALITDAYADSEFVGLRNIPFKFVKRADFKLLSIGQLQQVNVAPFFWQPGYTIGNSEANPYVDREYISGITSREVGVGSQSASNYNRIPNDSDNNTIDLSYLLNDALWDRYFFSGITNSSDATNLIAGTSTGNSRIVPRVSAEAADLTDFDNAARHLINRGALNVNSTSKEAWKGLLTAFRGLKVKHASSQEKNPDETVPIFRTFEPQQPVVDFTFDLNTDGDDISLASSSDLADFGASVKPRDISKVLGGFRYLNDDMIEVLAQRIVDEVRLRGPFLSVSDFVNRRLVAPDRSSRWDALRRAAGSQSGNYLSSGFLNSGDYDPMVGLEGINGTLQRAINVSGINGGINHASGTTGVYNNDVTFSVFDSDRWGNAAHSSNGTIKFSFYSSTGHYLDTEHLAGTPAGENAQLLSHSPGFVSQGDILSMIGSALTARGDTFLIRSYGDAISPTTGESEARVWLEAIVQRVPEPVKDSDNDYEPDDEYGRQFVVKSIRWLGDSNK
jgi:hypothetical protein